MRAWCMQRQLVVSRIFFSFVRHWVSVPLLCLYVILTRASETDLMRSALRAISPSWFTGLSFVHPHRIVLHIVVAKYFEISCIRYVYWCF